MSKGPKDINQTAFDVVAEATGGSTSKNVQRAKQGGTKRANALSDEERSAIAKKAAQARWAKKITPKPA